MKLQYKLTAVGWSEALLEDGQRTVSLNASYLSDALGELARGALAVLSGSGEVRFSFDEEPGEYRWVLKKNGAEGYALTIYEFTELWGNKADERAKVVFEHLCSRVEFARMVLKALEEVRHEHGEAGYKALWVEHEFPAEELAELHHRLKEKSG